MLTAYYCLLMEVFGSPGFNKQEYKHEHCYQSECNTPFV